MKDPTPRIFTKLRNLEFSKLDIKGCLKIKSIKCTSITATNRANSYPNAMKEFTLAGLPHMSDRNFFLSPGM